MRKYFIDVCNNKKEIGMCLLRILCILWVKFFFFSKIEFIFTEIKKKNTLSINIICRLIIVLVKFDKGRNYIYNCRTLMNWLFDSVYGMSSCKISLIRKSIISQFVFFCLFHLQLPVSFRFCVLKGIGWH